MGELFVENQFRNPDGNPYYWDPSVLDTVRAEPNITLYLNTDVRDVDDRGPDGEARRRSTVRHRLDDGLGDRRHDFDRRRLPRLHRRRPDRPSRRRRPPHRPGGPRRVRRVVGARGGRRRHSWAASTLSSTRRTPAPGQVRAADFAKDITETRHPATTGSSGPATTAALLVDRVGRRARHRRTTTSDP